MHKHSAPSDCTYSKFNVKFDLLTFKHTNIKLTTEPGPKYILKQKYEIGLSNIVKLY